MMKQSFAAHRDEMFITSKAGHEMWPGLTEDAVPAKISWQVSTKA